MTTSFSALALRISTFGLSILATSYLVGCGSDDDRFNNQLTFTAYSDATLLSEPVVTKTFTASELTQAIEQAGLQRFVPAPKCDVIVYRIDHSTTGLKGEAANATAAVMVPTSTTDTTECSGERPVTLYAHGTTPTQSYDLSALDDSTNPAYNAALLTVANFAAQGDIAIAPNYPGYAGSKLDYAPYVTKQQGRQMLDGLQAGLLAIEQSTASGTSAQDTLFVTGYSQGGYVAMATAQALDAIGRPATAVSPAAGPYAVTAFADHIMSGNVISGGTLFLPMIAASYNAEYNNIADGVFTDTYSNAGSIIPTDNTYVGLIFSGQLPATALFEENPTGYANLQNISPPSPDSAFGFAESRYLFKTSFRSDYVSDMMTNPDGIYPAFDANNPNVPTNTTIKLRQAFIDNDLRAYEPKSPMLLCGANRDPSVTYDINTFAQAKIWQNKGIEFAMVDLDKTNMATRQAEGKAIYISTLSDQSSNVIQSASEQIQTQFSTDLELMLSNVYQTRLGAELNAGKTQSEAEAVAQNSVQAYVLQNYHAMAAPYCLKVANEFFEQYR